MKVVDLAKYEVEALIGWHLEEQYKAANNEEYAEAAGHKRRVADLKAVLQEASHGP
jgi:hypothetical protein